MYFMIIALAVEAVFCKLAFNPGLDTDMTGVSLLLLGLNTVLLLLIVMVEIKGNDLPLRNIFLLGVIIHVAVLLFDVFGQSIFVLPNSGADSEGYHSVARSYAFGKRHGEVDFTDYSYLLSLVYQLMGVQKITGQFINVFLSIWALKILSSVLKEFKVCDEVRFFVVTLSMFLPNLTIISSILLRETLIYFLLIISLYFFSVWWMENKKLYFLLALVFSLAASALHAGAMACFAGYLLCFIFVYGKDRRFSFRPATIFLAILFLVGFMAFYQAFGDTFFEKFKGVSSAEEIVSHSQTLNSDDGSDDNSSSSYEVGGDSGGGLGSLILLSPVRMLYFIFAPLPWQWRGLNDIFAFCFSAVFYAACIYFALRAIRRGDKDKNQVVIALLIVGLISMFIMGWGVSSSGSALRHREKFTLIYSAMLGLSLHSLRSVGDPLVAKFIKNKDEE